MAYPSLAWAAKLGSVAHYWLERLALHIAGTVALPLRLATVREGEV